MVAAQGAGQMDCGSKGRGHGRWLIQHGLRATTWGDRSTWAPGAGQGRAREGARGSKIWGVLTCAVSKEHQQNRNPEHGADVELCLPNCAATAPGALSGEGDWGSILLPSPRGGAIAHPVPATTILNFLGFTASVRGTVPWCPLRLLPWPHGSVWEEAPAGSLRASAQVTSLQAQVPEGE